MSDLSKEQTLSASYAERDTKTQLAVAICKRHTRDY